MAITDPSGLLISWATPAASVPTEAMRSETMSRSCVAFSAVTSRNTATAPRRCPSADKKGCAFTLSQAPSGIWALRMNISTCVTLSP